MPGENRYLIIGIDEYPKHLFKKLNNAKVDGIRLEKVLQERYGFVQASPPIYDAEATRENIVSVLKDLAETSYIDDSLIIYFAGHGIQHPTSKKGFWMPYDGEDDRTKHINHSQVIEAIEEIQAKHILLVSDSCYSGTFITRMRGGGKTLTADELEALSSRWVFVSGGEEPVKDGVPGEGSPFGIALCNFLEQNVSPVLTAAEVFDGVIRIVENKGGQQPSAAEIRCDAHQGGQMVFRLRQTATEIAEDVQPVSSIKFELPEAKVQYYIPRLLSYYDHQEAKEIKYFQPDVGTIYLNSLIRTQKRVVLLGAAGSGKSVELLSLAHYLQNTDDQLIPIFKRFNTYTEENIADYLPTNWREADPNNLILFLDGLDEIQPKHFQTAIRKIMTFAQQNTLVRMVISCRNNFYELPYDNFTGTLDNFSVYTLNDVRIPQIIKYATENFEIDGEDFILKIQKASFLDLVQKPFFLNILIKYFKEYNNFDGGRAGIMEETLLKYYDNDKQHFNATVAPISKAAIFSMLEKLAFIMEVVGRNFLTDNDIIKVFTSPDDQERCKYLPAFNRDDANARWMFEHNNLQEYISSRVLNAKSSEEIINIIATDKTGELRVKPSWVNTLSFFISIGDEKKVEEIFEWIIKHDREVIVKFEPERISVQQRISLFTDIFNFYSERQIWLRSNKFSDKDLARFGESEEVLQFLLKVIAEKIGGRVGMLNAVHILSHYHIARFYNEQENIRKALMGILENDALPANDAYTVIGALSEFKISNDKTIAEIVDRYRERRNQYIRAALYKLIMSAKLVDQYIEIFIDGIDLADLESPADDRENVNLFDETMLLKSGLQKISTAKGIETLLDKLISSETKRELLTSDYKEILGNIVKTAANLYLDHPELFEAILGLFVADAIGYHTPFEPPLVSFFELTKTRWQAFKSIWENKSLEDYIKGMTMNKLLNNTVVEHIMEYLKGSPNLEKELQEFYEFVFWNRRFGVDGLEIISKFETEALNNFGIKLERPVFKDWQTIHRIREQASFDLWFDDTAMLTEIHRVFAETGTGELSRDQIFKYNHQDGIAVEERMPASTQLVFNQLTSRGRIINEAEITDYVLNSEDYQNLRISHIHSDLLNRRDLKVSETQLAFITNWANTRANSRKILWEFLMRFQLKLPDERLLDLTRYTHLNYDVKLTAPGSIEELEKFIPVDKLKKVVSANIKDAHIDMMIWISNVAYALRKNMVETYGNIVDRLESTIDFEYKFGEILSIWFAKTKDAERLKKLVSNVRVSHFRWEAIKLMEENAVDGAFLNAFFKKIIANPTDGVEEKIYAANHLMRQNDLLGFNYLADNILAAPDPNFDFRLNLGSISMLKNVDALPKLLQLLAIAKHPQFKRDIFNDFEERVLSAFHNIGIQSAENYIMVRKAIEGFITDNAEKIPNVNFLHFVIVQMEAQIKINSTEALSIDEAIDRYGTLFN